LEKFSLYVETRMNHSGPTVGTGGGIMTNDRIGAVPSKADSPEMFDRISGRYDLLNHLLSFGQDILWRRKLSRMIRVVPHDVVLDLACGTCDQLLSAFKHNSDIGLGLGIDMAGRMLRIGSEKVVSRGLNNKVRLVKGDGMELSLADNSVDFAMISFGIRNVVDAGVCLTEFHRILKPGGTLAVLEFSLPANRLIRTVYLWYFRRILPFAGAIISGDRQAYRYLNRTVENFYDKEQFCNLMAAAGFNNIKTVPLTFGTASTYTGKKDDL
jgi:demethylmenaquinone methyltransferase/2-methoxy-6-polyprenyl-1,4-benzoquinol methylase